MTHENLDIDSVMEGRRKAVEKDIREISPEDMKSLGEELFPYPDHPWHEAFFNFLKQNSVSTVYHAVTNDGIHVLYCRDKEKGIWFVPGLGRGPMQARGLKVMKEIVDNRKQPSPSCRQA